MSQIVLCPGIWHTLGAELYNFLSFLSVAARLQAALDARANGKQRASVAIQVPVLKRLDASRFFTAASIRAWEGETGVRWLPAIRDECDPTFPVTPREGGAPSAPLVSQHDVCLSNRVLTREFGDDDRLRPVLAPLSNITTRYPTPGDVYGHEKVRAHGVPSHALALRDADLAWRRSLLEQLAESAAPAMRGARPRDRLRVYLAMQQMWGTAWLHASIHFRAEALQAIRLLELDEPHLLGGDAPADARARAAECAYVFLRSPSNGTHVEFYDEGYLSFNVSNADRGRWGKVHVPVQTWLREVTRVVRGAGLRCATVDYMVAKGARPIDLEGAAPRRSSVRYVPRGAGVSSAGRLVLALRSAFLVTQRGTHWSTWIFNKRLQRRLPGAVIDVRAAQIFARVGLWTRDRRAPFQLFSLLSLVCAHGSCDGCLMWRGLCSRSELDTPNYGTWQGYYACDGPHSLGYPQDRAGALRVAGAASGITIAHQASTHHLHATTRKKITTMCI